jgi:hypothetical protein
VTFTVVQISEVTSDDGGPPIEVRTNVAYALTFKRAEYAALQLASVQPTHGLMRSKAVGGRGLRTACGSALS